jgi:hypothetical protein
VWGERRDGLAGAATWTTRRRRPTFNLKLLAGVVGVVGLCGAASAQFPVYPPPAVYFQPSVPLIVIPNTSLGVNPLTGGLDTTNTQVDTSYFGPGREATKFNGTTRPVDRPIYNPYGTVVGRQSGVECYNPNTGRRNGVVQNVTPRGLGGIHKQQMGHAASPMADRRPSPPARRRLGRPPTRPLPPAQHRSC